MAQLAYWEVYRMNPVEARKRMMETYQETGSIRETARRWMTSRNVVRKWVRRFEEEGEEGLQDRSRRPHHSPNQTPKHIEDQVMEAYEQTGYGRDRLSDYLRIVHDIDLSPHTVRHVLRRHREPQDRPKRKPLYPALWAWEQEEPFSLIQTDVKDVRDKGALGTKCVTHMDRQGLPRYQWTACEGRTRLRFLAYSHRLNRSNGLAFMIMVTMWLRAFGIETDVAFQTDWGQEFGGDNPDTVRELSQQFLEPLNAQLCRYPKGRKQYNGRVERSHRTDDEEFYRPYLLQAEDPPHLLAYSHHWLYFYNVLRPHYGEGMERKPPLKNLYRLGYDGDPMLGLLPPVLLDRFSTDLLLDCEPPPGNDLLASYSKAFGSYK